LSGIRTGQKSVEFRRGRARQGDRAVFQCGSSILRGIIVKKDEGTLTDVLRQGNYKNIISIAHILREAITYLKGFYGTVEGTHAVYLNLIKGGPAPSRTHNSGIHGNILNILLLL